jgi:hypothetical protein
MGRIINGFSGLANNLTLAAIFMGAPFRDITLYNPTPFEVGTPEFIEEAALVNFVCDLYVQNMNGYKPPNTTRITIQPAYHDVWNRTWKTGSIVAIAPFFSHDEFSILNKENKYKYILEIIQKATIQLSDEYQWDKTVFENAYNKTLDSNFKFRIEYPAKQSKDRKKRGVFVITKDEHVTSAYIEIFVNNTVLTKKLFDKPNSYWYDCIYYLAKHNIWFDNDRFGVGFGKKKIDIWYSIKNNEVELYESGQRVAEVDFGKYFIFN